MSPWTTWTCFAGPKIFIIYSPSTVPLKESTSPSAQKGQLPKLPTMTTQTTHCKRPKLPTANYPQQKKAGPALDGLSPPPRQEFGIEKQTLNQSAGVGDEGSCTLEPHGLQKPDTRQNCHLSPLELLAIGEYHWLGSLYTESSITILKAGKYKIKVPADLVPGRVHFLIHR